MLCSGSGVYIVSGIQEMEQQMVLDQEAKAAQVTKRRLQKTVESAKKKHEQLAKEVESFINFVSCFLHCA